MRRLSFFAFALLLALAGVRMLAGAAAFPSYLLRDGLLLWLAAATLFGLYTRNWSLLPPRRRVVEQRRTGHILLLTGVIVALAGGGLAGFGWTGLLGLGVQFVWLFGLMLLLAGAWWPGGVMEYAPPTLRWEKDVHGSFVQVPTGDGGLMQLPQRRRAVLLWLLVILAVGAFLRLWDLAAIPVGCVANECVDGLRLVEGQALLSAGPDQLNLFAQTARLWFAVTSNGVLSLRLTAALFGLLTLPATFGLAWRLSGLPAALLTTAVLALSPWAIWASRSSDPWTLTLLLSAIALWLVLQGFAHANARWWTMAGVGLGLLFVETPLLRPAVGLWALAITLLALLPRRRNQGRWDGAWLPVAALAVAGPWLVMGLRAGTLLPTFNPGAANDNLSSLIGALLRPDAATFSPMPGAGLLNGLTLALAVAGFGALARHLRQPSSAAILLGLGLFLYASAVLDPLLAAPGSVLLALLPLLLATMTVALQQFLSALLTSWGRLVRPAYLAGATALILVLVAGRSTFAFMDQLAGVQGAASGQTETDTARFISRWLAEHPDDQTTFIVGAGVANHPSLRLLAGPALSAGRVQPLEVARTLPFVGQPPGDLLYLVPVTENQTLDLLRQLYPVGVSGSELDESGQRVLFNTFQVSQDAVAAGQALEAQFTNVDSAHTLPVQTLEYPWAEQSPLPLPFSAQIQGSLIAVAPGNYIFDLRTSAPDAAATLRLDDLLVLDTSLGLTQLSTPLAQGVYRLNLAYQSGTTAGDLGVRWQPPGAQALESIPAAAMHLPLAPNQGLLGEYFANDRWEGTPVLRRKDLVVGLPTELPLPYSIHWRGKVAASRSGEYLIGVSADGFAQVAVDGQLVATILPNTDAATTAGYAEGLLYLPAGWHDISVRHAPVAPATRLRLLWQPAGSTPTELGGENLLPAATELGSADVPLPSPPPLADERLGTNQFALSLTSEAWQPQTRLPPVNLPLLPLALQWQIGNGCGAGDQQFAAPHGLAFAPDGSRLYIADTNNRRVQSLSVDGVWLANWSGELLQEPVDMAVADDGTPLVLDALAQQVFRLEPDNRLTPLPMQTAFYRPRGLDRDNNGNLLIADTGGGRVVVIAPDGTVVSEFGGRDTPLGRGQPVDALAANGAVWVSTAEDGRLWNSLADGSFTAIQPTNTIDGPHLAALPDGRFLATDPGRSSFTLFDVTGEPLGQFGYPGQLSMPTGIAATQLGDATLVAVSDTAQCTVSLWRLVE